MTDKELIQLYQTGKTLTELWRLSSISKDRIRTILKKSSVYIQTKRHGIKLPESEICELYKQDIPIEDIAVKHGVSTQPIVSILKKYNIRKPNQFKSLPYSKYLQVINPTFFSRVVKECISKQRVAEALDLNYDMVASLYKFHDIHNTTSADIRSLLNQKKAVEPLTQVAFERLYVSEYMSLDDVSKLMGVSIGYLRKTAREWGVAIRDPAETRISDEFRQLLLTPDILRDEVLTNTVKVLCNKYKVSSELMRRLLLELNIPLPFRSSSTAEQEICQHIRLVCFDNIVLSNVRNIIPPYELDIYIPELNLAVEYCGLYWHSENRGKDSNYHLLKHQLCEKQGIRLATIFQDEYLNKPRIVLNRLSHIVGKFSGKKLHARQCTVKEITAAEKNRFMTEYHIQGADICSVSLGLFFQNEMVATMTFARPSRSRNSAQAVNATGLWELNRFATNDAYHIRGAAGKLLAYFQRTHQWKEIYSYADKRWSLGELYSALGFILVSQSKPNYWYLDSKYSKREYRFNYTKHSLVVAGFDPNLTEREIMHLRGYDKIWDCGVLKFSMKNT